MLTNSVSIQTLLTQFQTRYPSGSVTSELLTIHDNRFVVRAVIQVGSVVLATAMAAATDVEQAEDRAKTRALTAFGVGSFPGSISSAGLAYSIPSPSSFEAASLPKPDVQPRSTPPAPTIGSQPALTDFPQTHATPGSPAPYPSPSIDYGDDDALLDLESSVMASFEPSSSSEPLESSLPEPAEFTADRQSYQPTQSVTGEQERSPEPEVSPNSATTKSAKSASTKGKSAKRKAESEEVAASSEPQRQEVIDRSDVNAKIGVEMKRLSWTVDQGRSYLKRTYGKRSRQELEDPELLDFLNYLESQPMPANSPF